MRNGNPIVRQRECPYSIACFNAPQPPRPEAAKRTLLAGDENKAALGGVPQGGGVDDKPGAGRVADHYQGAGGGGGGGGWRGPGPCP